MKVFQTIFQAFFYSQRHPICLVDFLCSKPHKVCDFVVEALPKPSLKQRLEEQFEAISEKLHIFSFLSPAYFYLG